MIGTRFAHYQVVAQLGAGGMGEVYRARDEKLGRDVAIKILPEKFAANPERLARFAKEARSASSLNHPNIVTIYEVGQVEQTPYIVMELVEGQSLRDLLVGRPLPLRKTLDIAAQTAEGLAKAHAAGIVHRDLKPENVMITTDGFVKVLDFGLAKPREAQGNFDQSFASADTDAITFDRLVRKEGSPGGVGTSPGVILGTAGYMSPEQAIGGPIDFRSDQFACGSILYEMLTGKRAFEEPTVVQTLAAIIEEHPEPITALNPEVPPPVRWITERCLAKEPRERYASTQDLAKELRNVRDHLGEALATPTARQAAVRAPVRKRLWRASLAVTVAAAGILALAAADVHPLGWVRDRVRRLFYPPIPAEKRLAILPFVVGGNENLRAFAEGLVEVLAGKLTQIERFQRPLWVVPMSEIREKRVDSASKAQGSFGATLVVTGSIQRLETEMLLTVNLVDARTLRQLRSFTVASPTSQVAAWQDELVTRLAEMLDLELDDSSRRVLAAGRTSVPAAYEPYLRGLGLLQRYDQAEKLEEAKTQFQNALALDPQYALAYAGQCEAHWKQYERSKRRDSADLAQASCEKAVKLNGLLAPVHVTLGIIHAGTGRAADALRDFGRALDLDPANADARIGLARTQAELGRPAEAEASYQKAIALRPQDWRGYSHLGAFYWSKGRYAEAEAPFRKVVELTPDNSRGYANLGGLYQAMGRLPEAQTALERSVRIRPNAEAYSNLASMYFFEGRYPEAARALEATVKIDDSGHEVWYNLGAAYYWSPGERERARSAYERAARQAEKEREVNPRDADLLILLADTYSMLGQPARARSLSREALALGPTDAEVWFRAGCIAERLGDRKAALERIEAALRHGYPRAVVERAPELSSLRDDARFPRRPESADQSRPMTSRESQ